MDIWKRFIAWCQRPEMIKFNTDNPGINLVKILNGIPTATVSGVIFGVINPILISLSSWATSLIDRIRFPFPDYVGETFPKTPWEKLISLMSKEWFLVSLIMSVIFSVVVGFIFVAIYDKLPGKTSTQKGIVFSLSYWVVTFRWLHLLGSDYWCWSILDLGTMLLWGWMLGHFYIGERLVKGEKN